MRIIRTVMVLALALLITYVGVLEFKSAGGKPKAGPPQVPPAVSAPIEPAPAPAPVPASPASPTVRARAGTVEITARMLSSAEQPAREDGRVSFVVSMSTHSGDLTKYAFGQNVTLSGGSRVYKPKNWEFRAKDTHHPEVLIEFEATAVRTGELTMVFSNLGGASETRIKFANI